MPICTHCGGYTSARGPFGEALHPECWEEQDDAVARVERREANRYGYDTSYYARDDVPPDFNDAAYERQLVKREQRYLENDANWT